MDTPIFDHHTNIIFLNKNADIEYKKLLPHAMHTLKGGTLV